MDQVTCNSLQKGMLSTFHRDECPRRTESKHPSWECLYIGTRTAERCRGDGRWESQVSWRPVVWQVSACLSWLGAFPVSKFKCLLFSQFTFHFSLSHINYVGTFKSPCRGEEQVLPYLVLGGFFQAWKGVWCAHLSPVTAEPECVLSVCLLVSWSLRKNLTPSLWEVE